MFTPPTPHGPDEHLMQERARRNALDANDNRGQSWRGLKSLSTGDVLVFGGIATAMAISVLLSVSHKPSSRGVGEAVS